MEIPGSRAVRCRVRFGISTQLYHGEPLGLAHLESIAAHGFDAVEIMATRSHVDYHDREARERVAGWLDRTGLRLHSIHAPFTDGMLGRRWGATFTNASPREVVRQLAVHETCLALELARLTPVHAIVVHPGLPGMVPPGEDPNSREALVTSVREIVAAAAESGVHVALENIPGDFASAADVASMLDAVSMPGVGACLDMGHANLAGGVVDAIETCAGTLVTTHVHDNAGTQDEHRLPFAGTIPWPAVMVALQKIGYDGLLMLEVVDHGAPPDEVLDGARRACARIEALLDAGLDLPDAESWT
jgi:sugar phosphate isomerase/epimerase